MAKEIPLTQGQVAIVDDEDFERVSQFKWAAVRRKNHKWYAYRTKRIGGKQISFALHRVILNDYTSSQIDHKNGDGLDNRRSNLRSATHGQNMQNRRKFASNTSGFKGVFRHGKKWCAQLGFNGEYFHAGSYDSPEEAARAYDAKAKEKHGEWACLNFPEETS